MSEIKTDMKQLYDLIENKAEDKHRERISNSTDIRKVSVKKIIEQLTDSEKEIIKKHEEAKKLWKQNVNLYVDFIKKNPGSKQISPPERMPELPKQIDDIRGYIRFYKTFIESTIYVKQDSLKELFKLTSEGISAMKSTVYALTCAISGNVVNDGGYYSKKTA